jgi:hypothetical protein
MPVAGAVFAAVPVAAAPTAPAPRGLPVAGVFAAAADAAPVAGAPWAPTPDAAGPVAGDAPAAAACAGFPAARLGTRPGRFARRLGFLRPARFALTRLVGFGFAAAPAGSTGGAV